MQVVAPAAENFPVAQEAQAEPAVCANVPATQDVQVEADAAEDCPPGQAEQDVEPVALWEVPATQLEHVVDAPAAVWNCPAAQEVQLVAFEAVWKRPAAQAVQTDDPVKEAYHPGRQATQLAFELEAIIVDAVPATQSEQLD